MKINEVLKKENAGKMFGFLDYVFEVHIKRGNAILICYNSGRRIEDIFNLNTIIEEDFEDLGYYDF